MSPRARTSAPTRLAVRLGASASADAFALTTTTGQPFDPFRPDTLASNGPLHPVMLAAFHQSNLADSSEG